MLKILVPTDLSHSASEAMRAALRLASHTSAEILFVRAFAPPVLPAMTAREVREEIIGTERSDLKEELEDYCRKLYVRAKIRPKQANYECRIISMPLVSNLIRLAKTENADCIIMGTDAPGLKKRIIGSNAAEIISRSPVPVIVIPEGLKLNTVSKLTLALDVNRFSQRTSLQFLNVLHRLFKFELDSLYINEDKHASSEAEEKLRDIVKESLSDKIPSRVHVFFRNNISDGIQDWITRQKPDLFAVLPGKKSVLEELFVTGTAKKLIYKGKVPLLVLP